MLSNTLVSICMVTYNQETFIAKAIEGVLMQKCDFDYHLIICDDASIDRTEDICKEYADRFPSKISFFRNAKNLGPSLNFIQALKKVSGDYIAFCEGDDYWTDEYKLQKQVAFLQENKEFNICFHEVEILMPDGRLVEDFITKVPGDITTIDDLIRVNNYIHTPSVVLRNNIVLPEWYSKCLIGDYPLYLLVVKDRKIKCLDGLMAVYRFGVGMFSKLSSMQRIIATFTTIDELARNYPNKRIKSELILKQRNDTYFLLKRYFFANEGSLRDVWCIISKFIPTQIGHTLNINN